MTYDAQRTIGSLFAGIGGIELGLERAGLGRVVWQVERDAYCRRVLARHWPDAVRHDDVRSVGAANLPAVDVICGGFPCQPVSVAGRRKAQADDRWLWPEFARIVAELRPGIVIAENVPGLRTAGLSDVLRDLASIGYDAEWAHLAASGVGAPHKRDRLFLAATHPDRVVVRQQPGWLCRACRQAEAEHRWDPAGRDAPDTAGVGRPSAQGSAPQPAGGRVSSDTDSLWRLESAFRIARERGWSEHCGWELDPLARVDDGVPAGLVGARRRALGNAVVVPVAETIGRAVRGAIGRAE